jgi:VWFA-related protein
MSPLVRLSLLGLSSSILLLADSPVSLEVRQKTARVNDTTRPHIRVDTNLVVIPVSVTDPLNRPVTGLSKDNFRVFDSNVEQQVLHVALEDEPIAAGIVFDVSRSMTRKMTKSRAAVAQFLRSAHPEDEFFLVEFGDRARLTCPPTTDIENIQSRLASASANGRTALLDAIALAMEEVKKSTKPRKALVIFSDGGDNRSRKTESEIRNLVREADVLIYAMGIFDSPGGRSLAAEELAGPSLLGEITQESGGRLFAVNDFRDLPEIAERIGVELHNRYVLGYAPNNLAHDGKYHKVRVKLVPPIGMPSLRLAWRTGYFAPGR